LLVFPSIYIVTTFCNYPIADLPGLKEPELSLLLELGIDTTIRLLTIATDDRAKQQLATKLGRKPQFAYKLVALADLSRLPSVGCRFNGLLLHTGIASAVQLAQIPPHRLHQQILRLHVSTMQRRDLCPDLGSVHIWVAEAKRLVKF
jgi:Domain of unknown function (DUF4332)